MKYYIKSCEELITDFEKQKNEISPYRKNLLERCALEKDKRLCLASALLLDKALNEYGLCEREMDYTLNENKKPYFKNCKLHFNISHSGEFVAVALSENELGIDIEEIHKVNLNIAQRFFTENEAAQIGSENDFLQLWVLKESFIKCIGKGLSCPLNAFEIRDFRTQPYALYEGRKFTFLKENTVKYKMALCTEVLI